MRIELRHAVTLFFATVFIDFLIFVFSGGQSYYAIGDETTVGFLAAPAAIYLLTCYFMASGVLRWLDRPQSPRHNLPTHYLPWTLALLAIVLILGVSGEAFFSIDALSRQRTFSDNPWLPRVVLFALPLAMMAIICASPSNRVVIFLCLVAFFSFTGSRIHVMALIVALVAAHSNRPIKFHHLIAGGLVGLFLLDFLATQRQADAIGASERFNLVRLFSSGHYSTFDIQTLLMQPNENLTLRPLYMLIAAIGPLRQVFGLQFIFSSSEYFTAIVDPGRYYNELSVATVGLTGEMFMIGGWFGTVLVGAFVSIVALTKSLLERLSSYNFQMEVLLRSLGFVYLYLLLRADIWIFFVYLWLQLPILIVLALYFSQSRPRS